MLGELPVHPESGQLPPPPPKYQRLPMFHRCSDRISLTPCPCLYHTEWSVQLSSYISFTWGISNHTSNPAKFEASKSIQLHLTLHELKTMRRVYWRSLYRHRLGIRWHATTSPCTSLDDSRHLPSAAAASRISYWKRIPAWSEVTESEFIDYKWQVELNFTIGLLACLLTLS